MNVIRRRWWWWAALVNSTVFFCAGAPAEGAPKPVETAGQPRDWEAAGRRGVVAADSGDASDAGVEMLKKGGNAVDAAVATAFCLSVVRPESCGIGGGGFMVIHLAGDGSRGAMETAIDFRERAPAGATPDMFEKLPEGASTRGGAAVAVPGTVAGLLLALEKYGTLDRATVIAPAIRAAREGFAADAHLVESWKEFAAGGDIEKAPFVRDTLALGGAVKAGDVIRNPEQAGALERIAREGHAGFYSGEMAGAIVDAARESGGVMTLDDLASFKAKEVKPLEGAFLGRRVVTMPPPSSGGVALLQILAVMEKRAETGEAKDPSEVAYSFVLSEAMRHAFADRARWLADDEFAEVPLSKLLDPEMLAARAAAIDPARAEGHNRCGVRDEKGGTRRGGPRERGAGGGPPPAIVEDHGTSHLSVVDDRGNAVACTFTINLEFGSGVAPRGFGFCLNNEMDDFQARAGEANAFGLMQAEANRPGPGKRPLSSMTPTIVLDGEGKVEVVAGASGGPR
ncbi:MAG TPA: gamma-glutamyltransferase, partial [Phycisphaerales bacterium]|nr:gamma-glutamyltransferase [Phycisphaerales bacterium]